MALNDLSFGRMRAVVVDRRAQGGLSIRDLPLPQLVPRRLSLKLLPYR